LTLFVDASALVAILAEEDERDAFTSAIRDDPAPLWSAMSCWEAVSSLRRSYGWPIERARYEVEAVTSAAALTLVPIGVPELQMALDAYQTYGRNSGHPAKLNMGDCFAYACAKANNARLLYKGDDFSHTDLA